MTSAVRPGTVVTLREQPSPVITINNKQYKITQIQMRKAGETAWQKVDFKSVDLKLLAEKCQQVFENTKPTQEDLSQLSFIFRKENKPGTPLILREIKYLRNNTKEMENIEVKVSLQSQLSHDFVDPLFHPSKKRKISPPVAAPASAAPQPSIPPLLVDVDDQPVNPRLPLATDLALD